MELREEIGKKVKWLLDNEGKCFFWVPLTAFLIGGAVAYLTWLGKTAYKRKLVDQNCLVCYQGLREILLSPCNHLILCKQCSKVIDSCPLCRKPIERAVPLGEYLSRDGA